jgi:hypothetical protein
MLEPEDRGRLSSLTVGRRIEICSSGDIIASVCVCQRGMAYLGTRRRECVCLLPFYNGTSGHQDLLWADGR